MAENRNMIIPGMETARRDQTEHTPGPLIVPAPPVVRIDRQKFYTHVRPRLFSDGLIQTQVDGISAIFNEWENGGYEDTRWLAYMLATGYHETDKKMVGIREYGRGVHRPYGQKIKHSGLRYSTPDEIFYGRGLVQLTWYENYELMGRLLGIDLLHHPDLALDLEIAVKIMFEGMLRGASSIGDFTGKCLEMYFNDTVENWTGARRIINGVDKAQLIADHAQTFYAALK